MGTRGETEAMQKASDNYGKEIERLINKGLDPQCTAIQRLVTEQNTLNEKIKESEAIQKAQADLYKAAETACVACYAAIGAGITAIVAATQNTAKMGDEFAKTARTLGITAEEFQELQYAANQNGIKDITPHLEKMNKAIIDVKNGTGTLTEYLKNNDTALLEQLQNVNNNEEAFMLLMDAIDQAPNSYSAAEIATLAFGKAGLDMINVANGGSEAVAVLREECQNYGIISNETAAASEEYSTAQTKLKTALQGVTTELTSGFIPGATDTINKIVELIAGVDDWGKVLDTAIYILAGVTAGLTAFMVVTKGHQMVTTFTAAIKGMNAAIAANPAGAIAVVITAVLIPALIWLIKNWDMVSTYLDQGTERISYGMNIAASKIKECMTVAFAAIKFAGAQLFDFIVGNLVRAIGTLLETASKIPIIGDQFKGAADAVNRLGASIGDMATSAKKDMQDAIEASRREQQQTEEAYKAKLKAVDEASRARREEIANAEKSNSDLLKTDTQLANNQITLRDTTEKTITENTIRETTNRNNEVIKQEKEKNEEITKSLQDKLKDLEYTETQIQNEQIEVITKFLQTRADLEGVAGEERITFLENQKDILLANEEEFGENIIAIQEAVSDMIEKIKSDETAIIIKENEKQQKEELKTLKETEKQKTTETLKSLKERLNNVQQTEKQIENERIECVKSFLKQRADLEGVDGEERIAFYRSQMEALLLQEEEFGNERSAIIEATEDLITELQTTSLSERLMELYDLQETSNQESIEQLSNLLLQKAELEFASASERIAFLQQQQELILSEESAFYEERITLQEAFNEAIKKAKEQQMESVTVEIQSYGTRLSAFSTFVSGFQELAEQMGIRSKTLAIAAKAIAHAEAIINTALGATKALAQGGFLGIAMAAGVIAAGVAQQIKIANTPIESFGAETGGRFIVPNNVGVDSVGLKVNPGEQVDITPRGEVNNGNDTFNFNFVLDGSVFAEIINKQARRGELYTLQLATNL
jgi:hypothetical protein